MVSECVCELCDMMKTFEQLNPVMKRIGEDKASAGVGLNDQEGERFP
jgi:hypothetical protein